MKIALKTTVISSSMLLLFLLNTNPQELPSVLLIVPFVLLFIIIASGLPLLLASRQLSKQRLVKIVVAVATVPVLLLVLQSLGQLTVRDVLSVFALFSVAYFYMSRFGLRRLTN